MNDYINDGKINIRNWMEAETEERFPEFYQKIRDSDAWSKHLHHSMMNLDVEQNIPKNAKVNAWNDWVNAKKRLVEELNEKFASLCDCIVGNIIRNDHAHWKPNTW